MATQICVAYIDSYLLRGIPPKAHSARNLHQQVVTPLNTISLEKKVEGVKSQVHQLLIMFHDDAEQEVTLTRHQEHLAEVAERTTSLRQDDRSAVVTGRSKIARSRLDDDVRPVNRASRQQSQPIPTPPRTSRTRLVCFSSIVFILVVSFAIFAVWQLGVKLPFQREDARTSAFETDLKEDSKQPSTSFRPTVSPTGRPSPSITDNPSLSHLPSLSVLPSLSPGPTISPPPSQSPSRTPHPSGSALPSQLPSIIPSSYPTAPTTAPSSLPTAPTELPSVVPSASPMPTLAPSSSPTVTRVCNGLASNCNMRANQIMYATVHNAMSTQEDGFLAFNNLESMEEAMVAGFRGFLLDSCDCGDDGVLLCHSICVAGTRSPLTVFDGVLAFLNNNPHEIIILEIQVTDNSLWGLWESTSTAFQNMIYMHSNENVEWPTLAEMIDMGRRLIVFQHNGGNCDNVGECPVGVSNMFRFGFETNWDTQGADELMDFDLSCPIKTGTPSRPNTFMLNNHFTNNRIGLPSRGIAEEVNTASALQSKLDACTRIVGRRTNLLAVDFWSIGDTVQVVNTNNAQLASDNIFDA